MGDLSARAPPVSRQPLYRSTMRLFPLLEGEQKSGVIWLVLFRQSPKTAQAGPLTFAP